MAQHPTLVDVLQSTARSLWHAFSIYDDQIRVVDLLPGSGAEAVALECRVISLNVGDGYEALSYVWGHVASKRIVDISGYDVEVTQRLYAAFQQLRYPHIKRTLWVDQLCIDQEDDEEKGNQIGLMRTIYRKCSLCLIWLGDISSKERFSTQDAEVALDFLHVIAYRKTVKTSHIFVSDNDDGQRARKAFESLIMGGNPWWSRVWTLQEASLPSTATLQWGHLTIPLRTVELAAQLICQGLSCISPSKQIVAEYNILMENFLYPVRGLTIARAGEPPLNTLMRWRYREATDPRDKVYGFIGLLQPDLLARLPTLRDINYTIEPTALFARVTLDLINLDQDLRPLVGARELPHVTPGLPTWAIDFASCSAIGRRQTMWWQHSHRYLRWVAAKRLSLQLQASEDRKSLHLSGILIDHIRKVGKVYHVSVEEDINDETLRDTIIHFYLMLEDYQESRSSDLDADYIGGGTMKNAFWRTMLGNLIMEELPKGVPKDHHMADFENYVNNGWHSHLTCSLHGQIPNHAFFITATGYIGMGAADIREGDDVCVFGGGRLPFAIRSEESSATEESRSESLRYDLIGDVYVHGLMRGEIMQHKEDQVRMIELV